jgi:hypothetical protein
VPANSNKGSKGDSVFKKFKRIFKNPF